ncbi:MAG: purine-binding chemotaxis protein CheW [Myxococcales bacterium]|nr:purine-binding chemotaxis protein CheW [Myxococcales bacterium]
MPIAAVKETIPERPLTRLGLVPPFVAGLINLRGEVVAVLDVGAMLGLGRDDRRKSRNIVILRANLLVGARDPRNAANRPGAGLLVDGLSGVRDVADGDLKPPPPTLAAEPASYLDGVIACGDPPRPLLLLAPERLLGSPQLAPYRREMR